MVNKTKIGEQRTLYTCVSMDASDPYLHRGERRGFVAGEWPADWPKGSLGVTLCGQGVMDYVTILGPMPECARCWERRGCFCGHPRSDHARMVLKTERFVCFADRDPYCACLDFEEDPEAPLDATDFGPPYDVPEAVREFPEVRS